MVKLMRAILLSVAAYALSFVTGLAAALLLGVEMGFDQTPLSVWIIGIIATIVISALFSWWYFKDPSIRASSTEGLHFALVLFIVSFALDLLFIVPYVITTGNSENILAYYADPFFWVVVLAMFVSCMYTGYYLSRQPRVELIHETIEEQERASMGKAASKPKKKAPAKKSKAKKGKKR